MPVEENLNNYLGAAVTPQIDWTRALSPGAFSPPNQPVPVPDYLNGWHIDSEKLLADTPVDYRREMKNDAGVLQYRYVPIPFILSRLNEACASDFGPQWGLELVSIEWGDWVERESRKGKYRSKDVNVHVQIVWPGQFRPIHGYGASSFFENNAQESEAKTINAAISFAIKSAAKNIGIGRDIEEDDPETKKLVDGRVAAIQMAFDKLVERGAVDRAAAAVAEVAPRAVTQDKALLVDQIDFTKLEPVQKALARLAVQLAKEAKNASAT